MARLAARLHQNYVKFDGLFLLFSIYSPFPDNFMCSVAGAAQLPQFSQLSAGAKRSRLARHNWFRCLCNICAISSGATILRILVKKAPENHSIGNLRNTNVVRDCINKCFKASGAMLLLNHQNQKLCQALQNSL
jgi:hypothetical protein